MQNVNDVTRVRINNKSSMLDLVFTRSSKEIDYLKFNPCLGKSDHVVLVFSICVEELLRHKKCHREEAIVERTMMKLGQN